MTIERLVLVAVAIICILSVREILAVRRLRKRAQAELEKIERERDDLFEKIHREAIEVNEVMDLTFPRKEQN